MKLRAYVTGFVAIIVFAGVSWKPAIARENRTAVYVRNECHEVLDVTIEYIPVGGTRFRTTNYVFSPGENGYLVDTDNLYIMLRAKSRESAKAWPRKQLSVGANPGKFTHRLTCR